MIHCFSLKTHFECRNSLLHRNCLLCRGVYYNSVRQLVNAQKPEFKSLWSLVPCCTSTAI